MQRPARLNVARTRGQFARPAPPPAARRLVLHSTPHHPPAENSEHIRTLSRASLTYAISLTPQNAGTLVLLARTAEYQNKEARRAVAAPARRPAGVALHTRQFSFESLLLRSSAASLRAKFATAKGFSFVPTLEDPALVLCFRARAATNPGLLRSRTARSVLNRVEIVVLSRNSVTVTLRNAFAGRFEIVE